MIDTAADALPQVRTGGDQVQHCRTKATAIRHQIEMRTCFFLEEDTKDGRKATCAGSSLRCLSRVCSQPGAVIAYAVTAKSCLTGLPNIPTVDEAGLPGFYALNCAIGQDIFPREQQTPEALGALQKAEIEKWWPIIKAANIKGE